MLTNAKAIRDTLLRNKQDLAFIVGNGINRYAYGANERIGWDDILLKVWKDISHRTLSCIPDGISATEFYDIMEFEAGSIDTLRRHIVKLLNDLQPQQYHSWLKDIISSAWNVPLLTTNFDENLDCNLCLQKLTTGNYRFSDVYPWNVYYSPLQLKSPTDGFAVWHINGMIRYPRSIRLGLSEYMSLTSKARSFLHKKEGIDDFSLKDMNHWKGYNTWLHIIFNKSLCIFGLCLDKDETFLRWLLIERAKYFRKFPDRKKQGWYVCKSDDIPDGKRFFLDSIGFEPVILNTFDDIYRNMIII